MQKIIERAAFNAVYPFFHKYSQEIKLYVAAGHPPGELL